jgi:predicted DNA binding CopG/RHH family protein
MPRVDEYEAELLASFDADKLKSVATKSELAKMRAAARATALKDKRVNIRLSAGDLQDIQVKALEEGMPYQTLIASVLHKYVAGRLQEAPASGSPKSSKPSQRVRKQSAQLVVQPERQRQATRPGPQVRGTLSAARAWRPPAVARLTLR